MTDIEKTVTQQNRAKAAEQFANDNGYFWLPCPLCGTEFGGHEWTEVDGHRMDVPDEWTTDEAGVVLKVSGRGICPDCTVQGLGCKRHLEIGFDVHEDCEHREAHMRKLRSHRG